MPDDSGLKAPTRTSAERLAVMRESIRVRCKQSIHSIFPMTGGLLLIGVLLWDVCPQDRLLGWLLTCFATTVIRTIVCYRTLARLDTASESTMAGFNRALLVTFLLNTIAMGAGMWWLATVTSSDIGFFVTLCLCFYAVGGLVNSSSDLPSFLAGLFANLGQAMVFWLTQGADGVRIAVLLASIMYLLCTFARQHSKSFAESIRIRFENVDLVAALSEKNKAVEHALAAAEEANRAKSRFLAAASHDLRQPLHALSLWAGLLQDSLTTPTAKERAEKMILSVESLDKLFSGLLDLSRFDSGSITPERRKIELQHILQRIDNDYRGEAQAKGIELRVTETAAWVYSDPLWLERILRNLLTNAIKYTQRGSVLLLCEESGDTVRVAIRDTGMGIGPREQEHIFEEYYQVHNPARDRKLGVGLGLAIVKRACDLLGHPISVSSTVGAGSEFSVVLPACAPDIATGRDEARLDRPGGELEGFVVVVVEDDHDVAQAMAAVLGDWGCVPVLCGNAEEANAALSDRGLSPDAVISDYRLRENLTGIEVVAKLREKYGPVPFLLITGEISVSRMQTELQPDYPVLQKPVAPAKIKSVLLQFKSLNHGTAGK